MTKAKNNSEIIPPIYSIYKLFDTFMLCGTVGLGICYLWARYLGHVGTFCNISSLVVDLPERVLFRLNFGFVGSFVALVAFPVHQVAVYRVPPSKQAAAAAAACQMLSGVGVVLVGACGPEEIGSFHVVAAILGFGGSGVAQIIYNYVFFNEDARTQPSYAKEVLRARVGLSTLFLLSAVLFILGQTKILPEPAEHIFEWGMWFFLLGWYFTFKSDLGDYYLGLIKKDGVVLPRHSRSPKTDPNYDLSESLLTDAC